LAIASKVLYVEEDPRIEVVTEALPGANCGGCGFAGCEAYAAAVINDPSMPPNKCCAGGPDVAAKVAELTGKAAGDADPEVAFRRCVKVEGNVAKKFEYFGIQSCAAAKAGAGWPGRLQVFLPRFWGLRPRMSL
jgi:Na+-translocating ferredoxin:NAD+ oxidoreductase subunit B